MTADAVLDVAAELVKRQGTAALTMRGLAAELGTAVTSIYWHVGNRDELLDALAERTVRELSVVRAEGATPAARVVHLLQGLRRELRSHPHLIALAHERGLTERMFHPAQRALVHEVHAAGLRGRRAARAVRVLTFHAVGFVLVERNRERAPAPHPAEAELWDVPAAQNDAVLAREMAGPVDTERLYAASLEALVAGLFGA
ncbi:TetR family transcriptional regulator [Streptomyces sp. NPDC051940]|uniref:TetR/AcrR family transcriptional regulator n=1 Tax=Streptomyces sp. NPDC051940 TaxID=3155675 RepID=UPI00341CE8C1